MALKHAIDREAIVKTVLKGHGVIGNDHPISTSNRYHAGELEQRHRQPELPGEQKIGGEQRR